MELAGIDPNWIIAGLAAAGAFVGIWRFTAHVLSERRERRNRQDRLWEVVFGSAAESDHGVVYRAETAGLLQRVASLEARAGHESTG